MLDCVWNVMAHAQKTYFVLLPNGRVHLNRQRLQFSRLLAAELCASAVVMLDTPCSEVVCSILDDLWFVGYWLSTQFASFPLPLPFVTLCHHTSIGLYQKLQWASVSGRMFTINFVCENAWGNKSENTSPFAQWLPFSRKGCVPWKFRQVGFYTGCFTTLGHNCRRWFPRSLWSKTFI